MRHNSYLCLHLNEFDTKYGHWQALAAAYECISLIAEQFDDLVLVPSSHYQLHDYQAMLWRRHDSLNQESATELVAMIIKMHSNL